MTLDELYGCTLDEYLEYLGKTREQLSNELEKEIELLRNTYRYFVEHKDEMEMDELTRVYEVSDLIDKKKLHLKRIKEWDE